MLGWPDMKGNLWCIELLLGCYRMKLKKPVCNESTWTALMARVLSSESDCEKQKALSRGSRVDWCSRVTGALRAHRVNTGAGSPCRNDRRGAVCTIRIVSFVQCWEIISSKNDWSTEIWCRRFQQKPSMLLWPICSGYRFYCCEAVG